jgi:hypothetical protein
MSPSTHVRTPAVETEFVDIPGTQFKVSRVALGTWAMGGLMWGGTDQRESIATIHAALHQGINLIHLAVRWMLDRGISVALWGGRRPDHLSSWHRYNAPNRELTRR